MNNVKYMGYYRCPDNIDNFKVRVRLKETNDPSKITETDGWESKTIVWQQKLFSKNEKDFYMEEKNCLTDLEKQYNNAVKKLPESEELGPIFTYTNEDDFNIDENSPFKMTYMQEEIEKLSRSIEVEAEENSSRDYDFRKFLTASMKNPLCLNSFEKMYILADLGEEINNTWIKYENVLCSLRYDQKKNLLTVFPDFTKTSPYHLEILGESSRNFYYFVENASEVMPEEIAMTEKEILKKVTSEKNSLKTELLDVHFDLPPKNKLCVYLFMEIVSGKEFEYDNIYVQYFIDLPENWTTRTEEQLRGITQTSSCKTVEGVAHFGHVFEVVLEYNLQQLQSNNGIPKCPYIYFEIISKDSWNRYRTEGLAYKGIPVSSPGKHENVLNCFRLIGGIKSDLRRFFIGDCSNFTDLNFIGIPKDYNSMVLNKIGMKTVDTGQIMIRMNVMHQSQAFLPDFNPGSFKGGEKLIFEKLSCSTLVRSVEQVLRAFKKARKNMIEARKNL